MAQLLAGESSELNYSQTIQSPTVQPPTFQPSKVQSSRLPDFDVRFTQDRLHKHYCADSCAKNPDNFPDPLHQIPLSVSRYE